MSAALNHQAFDDALERVHHERKAGEGMWAISKVHLCPGQFYYRFVDADRVAPPHWADGPWWVDYENYLRIRKLAEAGGSTLGYAARLTLAIAYEFSAVNGVVRAYLSHPVDALAGRGRTIADRASEAKGMTWRPPPDVMQLYIPRLASAPGIQSISRAAFTLVDCRRIESGVFA
jgi:hypothetical protein